MIQDENPDDDDGSLAQQLYLNAARTETPAKEDLLIPEYLVGNAAGGAEENEVGRQKRMTNSVLTARSDEQDIVLDVLLQKKLHMNADQMSERLHRKKTAQTQRRRFC